MPTIGAPAPDFSLYRNKSDKVTLSSLKGSKVVLAFVPAAFTGVCTKELCTFSESLAAFNDMDAKVFGISVDGPFSQAAWASQHGLEFPLLSDFARAASRAYGVLDESFIGIAGYDVAKRSVFLVDADGKLQYSWVAPNPGVEPDYEAIKAKLASI